MYSIPENNTIQYLAPIQCGTWLGFRESAWNRSWYASECAVILENRLSVLNTPLTRECDLHSYTDGCRLINPNPTKPIIIPHCRTNSGLNECGIRAPCPDPNPCGLGEFIEDNLNKTCKSRTYLALNVAANESNCQAWHEHAFLMDDYCVAACGRLDYECTLNETATTSIPPCDVVRGTDSIIITPNICAVPMPSNAFAGFRNGYLGKTAISNSECAASPNCTSLFFCFHIEGLDIMLLPDGDKNLPQCKGNLSQRCKINFPCGHNDEPELPFVCGKGPLSLSEAMWTRMGVYNCGWFVARDWLVVVSWAGSMWGAFCAMDNAKLNNATTAALLLLGLLLSLVWEFALVSLCVGAGVYCVLWWWNGGKRSDGYREVQQNEGYREVQQNEGYNRLHGLTPGNVVSTSSKGRIFTP